MSKVTLGDVATERRETFKDNGYEYGIVGLDQIPEGDLLLSEWGRSDTNSTFTKMFKMGDVLFGRRRAYLRKAVVAPFDGICSGDITVIRPNASLIYPALLPFVIQNDAFFDYAVGRSAGSLSPRAKWKDIQHFSFELPEMSEQHRLAQTLWTIVRTKQAYQKLLDKTDELVKSEFIETFGNPAVNSHGWPVKKLSELGDCKNGMNFGRNDEGYDIRCLGVSDFKDFSVIDDVENLSFVSLKDEPSLEYRLKNGDIVFVRSNGNKDLVGRCVAIYPGDLPVTYSGFCIRFRKKSNVVRAGYLLRFLKTDVVRKALKGRGANIQNLNQHILGNIDVIIPPLNIQDNYLTFVNQADKSKFALKQAMEKLDLTYKKLISENLG